MGYYDLLVAASDATAEAKAKADFVCDGTHDEVEIHAALNALHWDHGGIVALSGGKYALHDSIQMKPRSALALSPGSRVRIHEDTVAVKMVPTARISGGRIVQPSDNATILFQTPPAYVGYTEYQTVVEDVFLRGHAGIGKGIHFFTDDMGENAYATAVRIRNLYTYGFQYSILLEEIAENNYWAFFNSIYFQNLYLRDADYAIYSKGTANNYYSGITIQCGPNTKRAIYTEGLDHFNGVKIWDFDTETHRHAVEAWSEEGPTRFDVQRFASMKGSSVNTVLTSNTGMVKEVGVTPNPETTSKVGMTILPDPRFEVKLYEPQSIMLNSSVNIRSVNGAAPGIQWKRQQLDWPPDWWEPVGQPVIGRATTDVQTLTTATVDNPKSATWIYGLAWGNAHDEGDTIVAHECERELTAFAIYGCSSWAEAEDVDRWPTRNS